MNDFLQIYLQKYFDLFSFEKSGLYKLLKNIYNFICKRIFNFKKDFFLLYLEKR